MLFTPKKFKYKKHHKGKAFNKINNNINFNRLNFGIIGLKALSFSRLNSKHLITLRQTIKKIIKKKGKLKINAFPDTPVTTKSIGVRMGKGKGAVDHWVFKIKPGFILCEISSQSKVLAIKALTAAMIRLPIFAKIILH